MKHLPAGKPFGVFLNEPDEIGSEFIVRKVDSLAHGKLASQQWDIDRFNTCQGFFQAGERGWFGFDGRLLAESEGGAGQKHLQSQKKRQNSMQGRGFHMVKVWQKGARKSKLNI
ncbi:MAG: hypothetical protein HYZ94_00215 [Candidatus Omnitrophica bacterium]|nr:hypothetical protein [Candidatus Omnitrophota bacterium]